ncbi:MAG: hypothetical protein ACLQLE_12070 [Desulfobaccales bacterium]
MRNIKSSTPPHKTKPRATWQRPRVSKIDVSPATQSGRGQVADGPVGFHS